MTEHDEQNEQALKALQEITLYLVEQRDLLPANSGNQELRSLDERLGQLIAEFGRKASLLGERCPLPEKKLGALLPR